MPRNVTCRRVPCSWYVRCGAGPCATYQGKPGLWYLTARGVSLIGPINSRNSSHFQTCVSYVLFRKFKSTRREDPYLTYIILLMPSSVFCSESYVEAWDLTHGVHSSISYRCLHFFFFAFLLSFRLLLNILVFTVYLSQGSFRIPACPPNGNLC